jgi:hypothetical protein
LTVRSATIEVMKKDKNCWLTRLSLLFLLLSSSGLWSQQKYTLSGTVYDSESGETIIGARIAFPSESKGVMSNAYGFYSISMPEGTYEITVTYAGYETIKQTLELNANVSRDFKIKPKTLQTGEVVVTGKNENANTESTSMGTIELDVEMMRTLPAFLGEVDVLKTIQLLPGVSSANEGAQGFYVRGGGPDQNLVLLDEATVYNASHLFGFFLGFQC